MPRYEPDLSQVSATIAILDKDEYEFEIGKPKAFQRERKKGGESIGVRYPMTVAEGPQSGKRTFYSCYTHSDGGQGFAKQFLMCALGFELTQEAEKRFNEAYKGADWGFDTDSGECGDIWEEAAGKHIIASVDLGVNPETGEPNQQWVRFRPVGAGVAA